MSKITTILVILALILSARIAGAADDIVGEAWVVDGDTLVINGWRIRLFGVDAFEAKQTCGIDKAPCAIRVASSLAISSISAWSLASVSAARSLSSSARASSARPT